MITEGNHIFSVEYLHLGGISLCQKVEVVPGVSHFLLILRIIIVDADSLSLMSFKTCSDIKLEGLIHSIKTIICPPNRNY